MSLGFECFFAAVFVNDLHEGISPAGKDLGIASVTAQDHASSVFLGAQFDVWGAFRAEHPKKDALGKASRAVGHFDVRIGRGDFEFGSDVPLVVHQVEFAASKNRRRPGLRGRGDAGPKEIRGENEQIENRKADEDSLNFHIRLP